MRNTSLSLFCTANILVHLFLSGRKRHSISGTEFTPNDNRKSRAAEKLLYFSANSTFLLDDHRNGSFHQHTQPLPAEWQTENQLGCDSSDRSTSSPTKRFQSNRMNSRE